MMSRSSSGLALGLDGGQSGTAIAIGRHNGEVLGIGIAGSIRHPGAADAQAQNSEAVRVALADALRRAGLPPGTSVHAVHISTTAAIDQLGDELRRLVRPVRLTAGPDADIILTAAGRRTGVGIAAGTGTVAFVADGTTRLTHGGWGWLLGDEGSAYWIGAQAIRAVVRGHDGRGPATSLEEPLLAALGASGPWELFERVHSGSVDRPAIARLARLVAEHASHDDAARALVESAADELTSAAQAAHAALPTAPPVLVTTGGVLDPSGPIHVALRRRVESRMPGFEVHPTLVAPSVAAYLTALDRYDDAVFATARASSTALRPDLRKDRP